MLLMSAESIRLCLENDGRCRLHRSRRAAHRRSRATEHPHRNVLRVHAIMRDLHAAENQFSSFARDDARHSRFHIESSRRSFKSITPLEATMLYLSFMSVARTKLDRAAGSFNQEPTRGDVPKADSLFDVSIETVRKRRRPCRARRCRASGICARDESSVAGAADRLRS